MVLGWREQALGHGLDEGAGPCGPWLVAPAGVLQGQSSSKLLQAEPRGTLNQSSPVLRGSSFVAAKATCEFTLSVLHASFSKSMARGTAKQILFHFFFPAV